MVTSSLKLKCSENASWLLRIARSQILPGATRANYWRLYHRGPDHPQIASSGPVRYLTEMLFECRWVLSFDRGKKWDLGHTRYASYLTCICRTCFFFFSTTAWCDVISRYLYFPGLHNALCITTEKLGRSLGIRLLLDTKHSWSSLVLLGLAWCCWCSLSYGEKCWHFMQWPHKRHPDMQLWSLVIMAKIDTVTLSL